MNDVVTSTANETAPSGPFIADIPLKFGLVLEGVNFDEIDIDTYKRWLIKGAQAELTSARMGKKATGITKLEGAAKEKATAEFLAQCRANFEDAKAGKPITKGKAEKVSGAEQTEALRIAKIMVKDLIRREGQKIGAYSAKEITEMAKTVLAGNPNIMVQAKKALEDRANEAKGVKGLDIFALAGEKAMSEEVKAKPKKAPVRKKAEGDKAPLSAAQAGKVAPRQKPAGATAH